MQESFDYMKMYDMLEEIRDSELLTKEQRSIINEAHYVVQMHEEMQVLL